MRILVTGGCGFIGSNFLRLILQHYQPARLTNVDALTYAGNPDNVAGAVDESRYTFVRGDICDDELVTRTCREHDIDAIVHFAAESHVDRSILGCKEFIHTNIQGTQVLLDEARSRTVRLFLRARWLRVPHPASRIAVRHADNSRAALAAGDGVADGARGPTDAHVCAAEHLPPQSAAPDPGGHPCPGGVDETWAFSRREQWRGSVKHRQQWALKEHGWAAGGARHHGEVAAVGIVCDLFGGCDQRWICDAPLRRVRVPAPP